MNHPDDPFTLALQLCDDAGMVSRELVAGTQEPGFTYLKRLDNLRSLSRLPSYTGEPFACTGSAHLAGQHIRCTSPVHSRSAASTLAIPVEIVDFDAQMVAAEASMAALEEARKPQTSARETQDLPALGRRALACKNWRWAPRMLVWRGYFVLRIDDHGNPICENGTRYDELPDLSDPATLGILLVQARTLWGDPYLCIVNRHPGHWLMLSTKGGLTATTEAEALVAALELAP